VKKGSRVSWTYGGKRTFGTVTSVKGEGSYSIKGPSGGTVTRRGAKGDPIIAIKSESTGNAVLKKRSELRSAPKSKAKK
jgi:hypothetical protein|tara:strand:+ start:1956 stop:2192 length:237 start_codon:yes stop_codon:yes gene_type:complete